jgi:tRNA modification GTPase
MKEQQLTDTIAAIATPLAEGALSVIRISGPEAVAIASGLFDRDLTGARGYTMHYGMIRDNGEDVDEVIISIFRAPHSYTAEDMAEISCHGGVYITRRILALVLGRGARMARRGEFTQRAVLNGRIDLTQAESVDQMIRAFDEVNARSAVHGLKGSVTRLIEPLIDELLQIISQIEVNIDYPEYEDVKQLSDEELLPQSHRWLAQIDAILKKSRQADMIRTGIDTVILGKPNVGKSSLLNALLEEDKAIVTEVAGTTRDLVEGTVRLGDVTLNLIDTAGIHEGADRIEQMGIERSLKAMEKAELILVVLDSSSGVQAEDQRLLDLTAGRNRIVVYNKKDQKQLPGTLQISASHGDIESLIKVIEDKYSGEIQAAREDTLNSERQVGLAQAARNAMADVIAELEKGTQPDLVTIDLQRAYDDLRQIIGTSSREDLLDEMFSRFCLGK